MTRRLGLNFPEHVPPQSFTFLITTIAIMVPPATFPALAIRLILCLPILLQVWPHMPRKPTIRPAPLLLVILLSVLTQCRLFCREWAALTHGVWIVWVIPKLETQPSIAWRVR